MSLSHVCGFMATMKSTPPRRPSQPRSETRTSYQVGRPWMLEGKMLRGLTGTPMRRIALEKSAFAEADPEPFTLANLTTKSFTAASGAGVACAPSALASGATSGMERSLDLVGDRFHAGDDRSDLLGRPRLLGAGHDAEQLRRAGVAFDRDVRVLGALVAAKRGAHAPRKREVVDQAQGLAGLLEAP